MEYLDMSPDALQIVHDFSDWKKSYDGQQRLYYIFSPEWEEFQRVQEEEYKRLLRLLQATGTPTGPWQRTMERRRSDILRDKSTSYQPLQEAHRHLCPLSVHLDYYLGRDHQDRHFPWKTALSNWADFRELYQHAPSLVSSLSSVQLSSYIILDHWWSSVYCESRFVEAARAFMQHKVHVADTSDPGTESALREDADSRMTEQSFYHARCYELFLWEFHPQLWEPYVSNNYLNELVHQRNTAAWVATLQRLAFSFSRPDVSHRPARTEMLDYPIYLGRTNPWITRSSLEYKPYYLWDRELRKTVVYSEIPEEDCRDYVCISHTWGRWRVDPGADMPGVPWPVPRNSRFEVQDLPQMMAESSLGCRYIWLDLFCIPQQKSMRAELEIARQAAIFKNSRQCVAWLNDIESWGGLRSALAWFSRRYLEHTIRSDPPLLAASLEEELSSAPTGLMKAANNDVEGSLGDGQELIGWFTSLWTLQEALLCPEMQLLDKNFAPLTDNWGTPISLRCLILFINHCQGWCYLETPIQKTFSDSAYLVAITEHTNLNSGRQSRQIAKNAWPRGPWELLEFQQQTGLAGVMRNLAPAQVFSRALRRQCTGSRAPAIMSALGVTDWYNKRITQQLTAQDDAEEGLLFDTYPLDFFREAFLKLGASLLEPMSVRLGLNEETITAIHKREPLGSLIPFSRRENVESGIAGGSDDTRIDPCDHLSVKTWAILSDGSVKIKHAGIMSSSSPPARKGPFNATAGPKLAANLFLGNMKPSSFVETEDLDETLRSLASDHLQLYAVCLFEDRQLFHGVILLGCMDEPQPASGTEYLVRIGNFHIEPRHYRRTIVAHDLDVDWLVL